MNQREIAEIKRRLNPDKRHPSIIRGCYVSAAGQMISVFEQPVYSIPQEENEKYMAIFRRTLSGTLGQNLLPVGFGQSGEERELLLKLRGSALMDEAALEAFYQKVIDYIQAHQAEGQQSVNDNQNASNYLILLMHDGYDVPYRNSNDEIDREQSTDVFSYILCSVCPVKQTRSTLSYFASDCEFHSRDADWVVSAPELGFLYPAFEDRAANIHTAMYFTRDSADTHDGFIERVFGSEKMIPAAEQKETFQAILEQSLQEECSLDVVQAVHETVCAMMEERKADKTAEPLVLNRADMSAVLTNCGVSETRAAAFEEQYAEAFGAFAELPAVNVVTPKAFKVSTPSVSITVDSEYTHLVETRVIDGKNYIMILADGDVQVNGVNVKITE